MIGKELGGLSVNATDIWCESEGESANPDINYYPHKMESIRFYKNTTESDACREVREKGLIGSAKTSYRPSKFEDPSKFCEYHQMLAHETHYCPDWQDERNSLMVKGKINYVLMDQENDSLSWGSDEEELGWMEYEVPDSFLWVEYDVNTSDAAKEAQANTTLVDNLNMINVISSDSEDDSISKFNAIKSNSL